MKYELTENGVKDLETGAFIPNAEGNRHWKEYQAWLAEGNTPRPIKPSIYHSWDEELEVWVEDTVAKQAAEDAERSFVLEKGAGELFFRLCKILIDDGVLTASDPRMVEIKDAYLEYKDLKGI